jgi:nucleoside-diphosphate-sugar epimerase
MFMSSRYLLTGATGFVGGHIAEALVQRGWPVSAIVRPTSETSFLKRLNVNLLQGELSDARFVADAVAEADVVVHAAAKVGDWGPVEEYRTVNVDQLRVLLEACKGQALSRFIHVSSLGVYEGRHHYGTDETTPPPAQHADGYTQTKVESEQLALRYYQDFGVPVVVLRPGFVYGPRDRTVLPRIIDNLRNHQVRYPGGGGAAMNTIFVLNFVQAVLLALDNPQAVGQIYNLTDGEFVSKRQFIEAICEALGLDKPTGKPPLWLAKLVTWFSEKRARRAGAKEAPKFTFAKLKFMGYNLDFSIEKAKRELGYLPRYSFKDGMYETMAYYKQNL